MIGMPWNQDEGHARGNGQSQTRSVHEGPGREGKRRRGDLPDWRERSVFIGRHGGVEFFHYDPYGQTLAKLQRGHDRDLRDARSFLKEGLIEIAVVREKFEQIEPQLLRYPAIDAAAFRAAMKLFCDEHE